MHSLEFGGDPFKGNELQSGQIVIQNWRELIGWLVSSSQPRTTSLSLLQFPGKLSFLSLLLVNVSQLELMSGPALETDRDLRGF